MYLQAGSILQKIDYQLFKMKPQKIVIAIDSFKGCLTSAEAGEAAAQGVHAACPECQTIVLPVADGGEGMLDVLLAASNGKRITVRAHDPLMQPCDASYGISGDGNTAFPFWGANTWAAPLGPKKGLRTSHAVGKHAFFSAGWAEELSMELISDRRAPHRAMLAGAIEDAGILNAAGFRGVFSITPSPISLEQAMQPEFAQENIQRTVEQICRIFF